MFANKYDSFSWHVQNWSVSREPTRSGTFMTRSTRAPSNRDAKKTSDLERLIVGPQGGRVQYCRISEEHEGRQGYGTFRAAPPPGPEAMPLHSSQSSVVPQHGTVDMMSSDAMLHSVHIEGCATFDLPFPFPGKATSRAVQTPGLVNLRCNRGHVWMNAEIFVAPAPYYKVTDENGRFQFTSVPPGLFRSWRAMKAGAWQARNRPTRF